MRFQISRASQRFSENESPCIEAIMGNPGEMDWQEKQTWYIELKTLEDFVSLVEKYKSVVVSSEQNTENKIPSIVIYDYYIE